MEHEKLETVTIALEHGPHQLLDGVGPVRSGLDGRLHLDGRFHPFAKQNLEQKGLFVVEVMVESRFGEGELLGDVWSDIENLGAGVVSPALDPGLAFVAGAFVGWCIHGDNLMLLNLFVKY